MHVGSLRNDISPAGRMRYSGSEGRDTLGPGTSCFDWRWKVDVDVGSRSGGWLPK